MTKFLFCFLLLIFTSDFSWASRARLLAMGTGEAGFILGNSGNEGSFYFDDAYNIFYNPALINEYTDWATIEKSNFSQIGGATAQGGFSSHLIGMKFGLYLNRVGAIGQSYANVRNFRPIDVFFGSGKNFKWGVGLTYGSFRNNGVSDNDLTLKAGLKTGASVEIFGAATLVGKEKTTAPQNTYRNFLVGGKYTWGEWIPYAAIRFYRQNSTPSTRFGFGLGRQTQVGNKIMVYHAFGYWRRADSRQNVIPLEISASGRAVEWLTLRAGLAYRLVDQVGRNTAADATTGRMGATFHIGPVDFDWAFGRTGSALETGPGLSLDYDAQNFDIATGFFTAASLSYDW